MHRLLSLLIALGTCSVWADTSEPVLFHCDFEADDWYQSWGLSDAPERTELVREDPQRKFVPLSGRALRVRVDQ